MIKKIPEIRKSLPSLKKLIAIYIFTTQKEKKNNTCVPYTNNIIPEK
jgi:hypothetical protein